MTAREISTGIYCVTESNLRANIFISLRLIAAPQVDRSWAPAPSSLRRTARSEHFIADSSRCRTVQSHLSDLAIRNLVSRYVRPILVASRAHARFIIHLASRQPTARSWFLPHAFSPLRARILFFSLFFLSIPRRESDTCETTCALNVDDALNADMLALNTASINILYSSVREIAVRYGSPAMV